jgi:hypothetical protein
MQSSADTADKVHSQLGSGLSPSFGVYAHFMSTLTPYHRRFIDMFSTATHAWCKRRLPYPLLTTKKCLGVQGLQVQQLTLKVLLPLQLMKIN